MNAKRFRGLLATILFTLSFASIASESVTGGDIGGLFPAPKFLQGSLEGKVYTTPDKTFSIAIPYLVDGYEWKYAVVREGQDADKVTWVIFGPAAFNRNFYHAVLIKQPLADSFEQQAQVVFSARTKALSAAGGPFKTLVEKQSEPGVRQSIYAAFENEAQFVVLTALNFGPGVATIQMQVPKDAIPKGAPIGVDDIRKELISKEFASFNAFFDSFAVTAVPQ